MKKYIRHLVLVLSMLSISSLFVGCDYSDGYDEGYEQAQDMDGNIKKPIIYIYPEEPTDVKMELSLKNEELTCVYPKNKTLTDNSIEWNVRASEDGTLKDYDTGLDLYSLYWEPNGESSVDFSTGSCVKGEETSEFLNDRLRALGLNAKETEEFIVYWLPKMESNKYNLISFDTESYTENAELSLTPEPDSLIRVFMSFKGSDKFIKLQEQDLGSTPSREGYTVVEWGGTEVK